MSLVFGVLGAAVAFAASHFAGPDQRANAAADGVALRPLVLGGQAETSTAATGVANASSTGVSSLAMYAFADGLDSVPLIEAQIQSLAREQASSRRDRVLEALLLKYTELDPISALRFVRALPVPDSLIVTMFAAWSADDRESALAELRSIDDVRLQRDIAIAIAMEPGAGQDVIAQLANLVEPENSRAFVSELLVRRAESDPASALSEALALGDHWVRYQTAMRIAAEWVRRDPLAALTQSNALDRVEPRIRHAFRVHAWHQWVGTDPDAALTYLTSPDGLEFFLLEYGNLGYGIRELAVHRPEALLAASDTLPLTIQHAFRSVALPVLVDQDLAGALQHVQSLPNGTLRSQWIEAIAVSYARQDPERSLQWARAQEPAAIIDYVLSQIASSDLEYAVDFALQQLSDPGSTGRLLSPENLAAVNVESARKIAGSLFAAGDAFQRSVSGFMESWTEVDPESVLAWVLENRSDFDRGYAASIASGIARSAPDLAASAIDTLPPQVRGDWVAEIAAAYAGNDPGAARQWLTRFRSEPDYDALVTSTAEKLLGPFTGQSPGDVAAILSTAQNPDAEITRIVAREWARTEPAAAAEWALGWPRNPMRDGALSAILTQNVLAGDSISARILDGFSSDAAVEQAFTGSLHAFSLLAERRPDVARRIAGEAIRDPGVRRRVEAEIERAVAAAE